MKKIIFPQDQNFWYLKRKDVEPLRGHKEVDVVVIGGGMSGLTAAQAFANKGQKVILLEAFNCGAGASGKSSGFITPNGEVSLAQFVARYGVEGGKTIWDAISNNGIEHIRRNIKQYQLDCDYIEEDSLEVASTEKDLKAIISESEYLARFGYSTNLIKRQDLPAVLGTTKYYGGVIYAESFGISGYKYCQSMKDVLSAGGVEIYEETPALSIQDHLVTTLHGSVRAKYIIVCTDRFIPHLGKLQEEIYHVQNFLLLSEVLSPETIRQMFPQKKLMVFDTELIYSFYRMTGNRLLIGGGSPLNVFNKHATYHSHYMYRKLSRYIAETFPGTEIQFEQMWPGLIGISQDMAPLAGRDKDTKSIYYIGTTAGLSLAAMLGNYCADHLIDGSDILQDYFSPYRKFKVRGIVRKLLGKRLSFAVSQWL